MQLPIFLLIHVLVVSLSDIYVLFCHICVGTKVIPIYLISVGT